MKASDAVIRAEGAGLVLTVVPDGLSVRGPKAVRAALVPMLRPLTDEILALLTRAAPCISSAAPCLGCGFIHGAIEPRPPCSGCGRTDWIVTKVTDDGDRFCPRCLT